MAARHKLTPAELKRLHKRYLDGETSTEIAREAGCAHSTLNRAFVRAGLPLRKRMPRTASEKSYYNARFPDAGLYALVQSAAVKINESVNQFIITAAVERAKSLQAPPATLAS